MRKLPKLFISTLSIVMLTSCNFGKIIDDFGDIIENLKSEDSLPDDKRIYSQYMPKNLKLTYTIYGIEYTTWKIGDEYYATLPSGGYLHYELDGEVWSLSSTVNGETYKDDVPFTEQDIYSNTGLSILVSYRRTGLENYQLSKTTNTKMIAGEECVEYKATTNNDVYKDFYITSDDYIFETVTNGETVFFVLEFDPTVTNFTH